MDWKQLNQLLTQNPEQAISEVSWLVEGCSDALRDLHEEEDRNDWLYIGSGAILESCKENGRTPEEHWHVHPEIPGQISVTLQIGDNTQYMPLKQAIKEVVVHFEQATEMCLDCQTCLGRGASDTAIDLWDSFDEYLAALKVLIEPDATP